ncbi:MAG: panthothenate synthetase [Bryobacteraceae bacterium]|nr:panthothenate synthetase [Bryobacteraceae bacterium]
MRMLMHVQLPLEPFNTAVREGTAGQKIQQILEAIRPEAVYFTEQNGHRGGTLVVNVDDASDVPKLAEPWFLTFNAEVEFRIAMTPEDLARADLGGLGKKWGSEPG